MNAGGHPGETTDLKSSRFRREREQTWRDLEQIVDRLEKGGVGALSADELSLLPSLYRGAASSLAVARAISLDRGLLDYLDALVARGYIAVYGNRRPAGEAIAEFFRLRFPQAVRRHALYIAAAFLVMILGALTGWRLTLLDSERYYSFVGEGMSQGRTPSASTQELREALYSDKEADGTLGVFASFLFTHNAKVGILCFALGFAAGVPVLFLLFSNGLTLGAFAALYQTRGLGMELWAWLLPHGVSELTAVCLCGAAGLILGNSLIFPGPHTRLQNLALRGRSATMLVVGAVVMLLVAGLIEGIFRQVVHDPIIRWSVAVATFLFWSLYFLLGGREP
ncbi:MAG TPA: stage II sporulation protein M [Thermoanaerobaculia bacterium]|jgi:uncharacterized membrane protein SpoIIM required for sporulation|nr:stage II sporulation protein M [Thermoanaerobaculia bacterium]